ncbi:MAG: hypothetical protein M1370_08540 [Bacteroidetes bacterium]|nr:hypothetical protein [Bacteroidota bacterium]MCL5027114.1 hypothetical protein [Chloroflexota bacterium]
MIHLQDILDSKDKQAIRLANSIDADLIQLNEGIIDEETFHDRLQAYVRLAETVSNSIGPGPDSTSSTDARTEQVTAHWEDRPPVVDYRLDYEWVA